MVGCSAVGCKNRREQGYIMKVFPRDPIRRKEWAAKVRRKNWTPNNNSYLCEVNKHEKYKCLHFIVYNLIFSFTFTGSF